MKFGIRIPSIKKRIAARISVKRMVRQSLGLKAPRGWGWLTNPKKAAYNRIYNRTSVGCGVLIIMLFVIIATLSITVFSVFARGGGGHGGSHSSGTVHVNSYTRKDGTVVSGYDRSTPGSGSGNSSSNSTSNTRSSSDSHKGNSDSSSYNSNSHYYTWEDDKGGMHATNDRSKVPSHVLEKTEGKNTVNTKVSPAKVSSPAPQTAPEIASVSVLKPPSKVLKNGKADNYYDNTGILRDGKTGRIHRSVIAKNTFKKAYPCPSTGRTEGACPGYVIDHIKPLKKGGKDLPSNMQWQTVQDAKAKDKWE